MKGGLSGLLMLTSGVPQGTVFGPVLFVICVNGITLAIPTDVSVRASADEGLLFEIERDSDRAALADSLSWVYKWCKQC